MSRQVDVKSLISHLVRGDGNDKCRICMGDTSEGQVFLEDTVLIDSEQPVTLSELLFTITGVQLFEESFLPIGVCVTCVTATIAAYELRTLVQQSNKAWNNSIKAFDELPSPNLIDKPIICFIENERMKTTHFKKPPEGPKKVDVLSKLRKNVIKKERKPRTVRNGPRCECVDCGKKYSSPYYLNLHLKNSSQKEVCQFCGKMFIRGEELQRHLSEMHRKNYIKCPECPVLSENDQEAAEHKKIAHSPSSLTCYCCGRTFNRESALESHSQMHEVRTCRKCERQFTNRVCYREHRLQCEPDAKPIAKNLSRSQRSNIRDPATYICDYCKKSYKTRPQLKNHILWIHMNHRPFQCNWCKKRFYTSARLLEHTIVHTRERNFTCDICQAKLVTKMAMVYHKRRHTGEKPYECEDCGEKFLSASRRSEHAKRRHKKGKRFQCNFCPLNFAKGIELRRHKDKYHVGLAVMPIIKGENTIS